jgi:hypothetical protein
MAAKKDKKGLPEITVNTPEIISKAKEALEIRRQLADLTARETAVKKDLADLATVARVTEETNQYIGLVRIVDESITPCQVQFKITGGALALEEGPVLDQHFGAGRPMLFERDVVITGAVNPDALIAEIRARNQNPWDYLELKVKKGLDRALADSPNVTKEEAFLPKEGFLATLNEIKHTFSQEAKSYISQFLAVVLKPAVDLGKK